jgi:hypothetical protein
MAWSGEQGLWALSRGLGWLGRSLICGLCPAGSSLGILNPKLEAMLTPCLYQSDPRDLRPGVRSQVVAQPAQDQSPELGVTVWIKPAWNQNPAARSNGVVSIGPYQAQNSPKLEANECYYDLHNAGVN